MSRVNERMDEYVACGRYVSCMADRLRACEFERCVGCGWSNSKTRCIAVLSRGVAMLSRGVAFAKCRPVSVVKLGHSLDRSAWVVDRVDPTSRRVLQGSARP
jgi:hypothetical protein